MSKSEERETGMKEKLIERYFDSEEQYEVFRPIIKIGGVLLLSIIIMAIIF